MNKFFLYARKSTDVEDKQVLSIEAQLAELRNYAKLENLSIIEEIVEKQSAKSPGRPLFNAMMSKLERGEGNGIVSWNPDRLARNSVDGGKIIYLLDTGRIVALKFPTFWFEPTPQGKFMLNIAFGQSKYYVDSLAENTKRGLRQKVRRGEYPNCAPVGYLNDSRTKTIVINRKRSVIIRQAFELYAKGNSRLEDIATFLETHGIISYGGKRVHINRVTSILKNPFYYGHFRYLGEMYVGKHQPVVAKHLFDQVQEILHGRGRPHHQAKNEPQALCGLLHCSCGMMITGEHKTKHQMNGNTHHYVYYHCSRKSRTVRCTEPTITEPELARQLSFLIKQYALPTDWAEGMRQKLAQDKQDSAQSVSAFVQATKTKLADIQTKLQRLLDGYLDQLIDQSDYREQKTKLMSEKKTLEEKIETLAQTQTGWVEPFANWINQAENLPAVAECDDLLAKKVVAKQMFGSNLRLSASKASGTANDPWSFVLSAKNSEQNYQNLQNCPVWVPLPGIGPGSAV